LEKLYTFQHVLGSKPLTLELGKLAGQADAAITVRYGDTLLLVTVCISPEPRKGIDFIPLTIDYEERLYAAGKIPGSFFRREGRPGQEAVLAGRLTDRPIRPLLPKGFRHEVQIIATVLSADQENQPDVLATVGASTALTISDIPFAGPAGAVRVGYLGQDFVINPTYAQVEEGILDLVVVSTKQGVMMVEAGAKEAPEEIVLQAIRFGHEVNQGLIRLQEVTLSIAKDSRNLATMPARRQDLEQTLARHRAEVAKAKDELATIQKDRRKLEGDLAAVEARISKYQGQLM